MGLDRDQVRPSTVWGLNLGVCSKVAMPFGCLPSSPSKQLENEMPLHSAYSSSPLHIFPAAKTPVVINVMAYIRGRPSPSAQERWPG